MNQKGDETSSSCNGTAAEQTLLQSCNVCAHKAGHSSSQRRPKWEVHASKVLGKGMEGVLRLATRAGKRGPVYAVKVVPTPNERTRKRALHEASLLRTLDHPNIRRFVDCFEEHGNIYMVLEYIDGCDLSQYIIDNGVLDETRAFSIMEQMLDALRYCHTQEPPIMHGDVKPENMMLSKRTNTIEAKLIDFGLAVRNHRWICRGKTLAGTPAYISPEAKFTRVYTPANDIWAMGVVLHAMLTKTFVSADVCTGQTPFTVKSSSQMSSKASKLLTGLLQLNPNRRLTAAEALTCIWCQAQPLRAPVCQIERSTHKAVRKIQNKRLSAVRGLTLDVQAFNAFDKDCCPIASESTRTPSTPGEADESVREPFPE